MKPLIDSSLLLSNFIQLYIPSTDPINIMKQISAKKKKKKKTNTETQNLIQNNKIQTKTNIQ